MWGAVARIASQHCGQSQLFKMLWRSEHRISTPFLLQCHKKWSKSQMKGSSFHLDNWACLPLMFVRMLIQVYGIDRQFPGRTGEWSYNVNHDSRIYGERSNKANVSIILRLVFFTFLFALGNQREPPRPGVINHIDMSFRNSEMVSDTVHLSITTMEHTDIVN